MVLMHSSHMKTLINTIFVLALFTACQSIKDTQAVKSNSHPALADEEVLFTVDGQPVYAKEFDYVYRKNNANNDSAYTKADIDSYLDLYKKFKIKIAEAKSQGLDTTKSFRKEFNTYKEQLKKPYLTESKVTDKLEQEAYDRYKTEVKASHILLKVDPNASPTDTLEAYQKLLNIKKQAEEGKSFSQLAREYSEDPSAARNGGDLGYFTSFQMVYPFESAAYDTPAGEISNPVRTRFGYHIIKVWDKRPSQGSVTVSHLMIRIQPNKEDSLEARNKIFELYDQATGGANWEQLVEQFSEDVNSKQKGGLLPPFKVGQMPYSFQEAAFALQEPGQISDPVMTPYGWHIIKLEKREPLQSFEEMESFISSRVKRDSRADINKKALINRLKKENGFEVNEPIQSKIYQYADSSLISGKWSYHRTSSVLDATLFTVGNTSYKMVDFFDYILKKQRRTTGSPRQYMQKLYEQFEEDRVIAYEEAHLEDKYYDYKMLVQEYREGIMLFQLMEDEVWQKAVDDTTGLKNYYENHRDKYKWSQRVEAVIYNAGDKSIIDDIKQMINTGDSTAWSKKELENKYNQQTALTLQVESGIFEKGDNALIDKVQRSPGMYELVTDNRYILVNVQRVMDPAYKPFNRIKGLVISDYQNYLEKQWMQQLKKKYPVEVNEEVLKNVYKALIK